MSNDLIDRYVGATLRTVPESQRSDIEAELRNASSERLKVCVVRETGAELWIEVRIPVLELEVRSR